MNNAVGPASTNDSITLDRGTANDHTNRDPGWTTTPQHDYQPIEMDVNWEPMQKSRLPVQIVNKPLRLRAGPAEAKTSTNVRDVPIEMQALHLKTLQIGPTST